MSAGTDVQERFERALESLVEKARQDRHILAAVLMGSLGGEVVATGTPEEIAKTKKSHTGRFLRAHL